MIKSFKKNWKGILLMLFSALFVCIGQLFWKLSVDGKIINLCIGFILYGFGALIMIYAYKFGSLSVLQPMLSCSYIFSIFLANRILNEEITLYKIIGVVIITIGVILIGGGDD